MTSDRTAVHAPPAGRLLAIGDIHGCRDQLRELLERVAPQPEDRMVFLGDYLDRGPQSRGVIEDLLGLAERFPETVFLRGNHEQMFLDFLDGTDRLTFLINGGQATLKSYGSAGEVPPAHLDFLRRLPCLFVCGDFVFVHAGLRPGLSLEQQREQDLLWIRHEFLAADYDWGRTVVFGHTPLQQPLLTERRIGVDTGAVYGRTLTCCDVNVRRCWQVP